MADVPAPKNDLVTAINSVIDILIKGLGADAAYAAVVAQVPWLGLPVISYFVKLVINHLAGAIDTNLKINIDIIVIRYQNQSLKEQYDKALESLKTKLEVSDEELKAAKLAIDHLIHKPN